MCPNAARLASKFCCNITVNVLLANSPSPTWTNINSIMHNFISISQCFEKHTCLYIGEYEYLRLILLFCISCILHYPPIYTIQIDQYKIIFVRSDKIQVFRWHDINIYIYYWLDIYLPLNYIIVMHGNMCGWTYYIGGMHRCIGGHSHWIPRVIMMPTLSSMATLQVVVTTTCSGASDDKVGIMETLGSRDSMMPTLSSLAALQWIQ